jgi:NH3-dependent NAD+ synthetase
VVEAFIERDQDVGTIVRSGIDPDVVEDIVRRITLNEYKRRQAAPGLKITSKAFGVGRRFPIAAAYQVADKPVARP